MKTLAIHQPQYLPYLGFFHKVARCDEFIFLDHVQYQVNGLINRNKIRARDGWQWLTLAVNGRPDMPINQVQIDPRSQWRKKHWATLQTSYGRAPFFKTYADELKALYAGSESNDLSQACIDFARWGMKALGVERPCVLSSTLDVSGSSSEMLINLCRARGATRYISGPGGRQYMDLGLFAQAGIEVVWQEFTPPSYPQLFPATPFVENLSALDVLLSVGPSAGEWLR